MIISNNIHEYSFSKDLSIKLALEQLERTGLQILFLVDSKGLVSGVVTDGDVRRWMLSRSTIDLSQPISIVAPSEFVSARQGKRVSELNSVLTKGKTRIPLVDAGGILVGVLSETTGVIAIGEKSVGPQHPVYVIAEIGNNHNGCLQRAKDMIDLVQKTGADCVKFQMRHMEETYRTRTLEKSGDDLGTEYVLDLLERFQITNQEHKELSDYCKEKGILYLCTPWDLKSVEVLETFNVNAYKVSSADLTNLPLLDRLSQTKKPLILSSGMSTTDEVTKTISFLNKREVEFAILHCNSTYPAPLHDINLRWIDGLKKLHSNIGYSGHERGINVSLAATAMGASIIERHFTLDRNMEGPDHAASLEFNQFSDLVIGIREIEQSLGRGDERIVSQGEMINRENWITTRCELIVIEMENYTHNINYDLPIKPSPNLPNSRAVNLYPSLCLFEGTNISVGRGTDYPFQHFGAPYLENNYSFTPKSGKGGKYPKYEGEECFGTDLRFQGNYLTTINLNWLIATYNECDKKEGFFNAFFDKLAGTNKLREQIIAGGTTKEIKATWENGLSSFRKLRGNYLLYK